ncbi:MAG: FadR/GntR family transcriptional regulator [Thermodesulfobacteriota bacterium]
MNPDFQRLVQPVKFNRKSDQIVVQLKQMIAQGILEPGRSFPAERELSLAFRVSRSSIREAIRSLENMKLVERTGPRRVVVRSVGEDLVPPALGWLVEEPGSLIHYFETRLIIECGVIRLAATRREEEDLRRLSADLEALTDGFRRYRAAVKADMDFHRHLAQAAHNPLLVHIMASFLSAQQRAAFLLPQLYTEKAVEQAIQDHTAIFEGIRDRDAGKAEAALDKSLSYAMEIIKSLSVPS